MVSGLRALTRILIQILKQDRGAAAPSSRFRRYMHFRFQRHEEGRFELLINPLRLFIFEIQYLRDFFNIAIGIGNDEGKRATLSFDIFLP